ncbi:MAG: Flp pilus assembly complex ATPase component TadA [Thermoleophilaceae bacterium]|nr:Flp pilus assembly complex ATPase component TadA [Thermoleophilaceae bacterium]
MTLDDKTASLRSVEDVHQTVPAAPAAPPSPQAAPSLVGRRIGEIVVALGFATENEVASAVEEARQTGRATGRVLFDRGTINKNQLAQAIAARTQISYIDLRNLELEERALNAIDGNTAARYRAVPVQYIDNDTLLVAIAEPSNVLAVDDIALMTGLNVRAALTTEEQLEELLSRLSRSDVERATKDAERKSGVSVNGESPETEDEAASANLLESVLTNGLRQRASDIHFETLENHTVRVRYRIDGITHDSTTVAASLAPRMFARLKLMAGMDISQHHIPQDGRTNFGPDGAQVTLRVATLPTILGESAAVRILDRKNVPPLERLGLDPTGLATFMRALRKPHGAILATGPTGSGKTTTLYAALSELNTPERTIITIEDPVEYPLPGIRQVQVNNKRNLTFSSGLRTMLRSDPDVVMVGEIRDHETAKIGIEAALTGRLVLTTLHTNDAASAVTRLTEMGVERYLVASSIECVVASRLARKLCVECRTPATIDENAMREAGYEGHTVESFSGFKAVGCARCANTGYRGRTGIFEVLSIDERIRELLLDRFPAKAIESAARENGMVTLAESALERVRQGVISLAEAARVTSTD